MILQKKSVIRHIISPLKNKGYNIKLIGSISKKGYSDKDIDILLYLPEYPKSDEIFTQFEKDLKKLRWDFNIDDYTDEYGLFHNYTKKNIGLDVFIEEKIGKKKKVKQIITNHVFEKFDKNDTWCKYCNLPKETREIKHMLDKKKLVKLA